MVLIPWWGIAILVGMLIVQELRIWHAWSNSQPKQKRRAKPAKLKIHRSDYVEPPPVQRKVNRA